MGTPSFAAAFDDAEGGGDLVSGLFGDQMQTFLPSNRNRLHRTPRPVRGSLDDGMVEEARQLHQAFRRVVDGLARHGLRQDRV